MIIEIEFPVTVQGRPARSPKDKTIVFKDTIRFDFPDYGPSEVRTAITADTKDMLALERYFDIDGELYGKTGVKVPADRRMPFVLSIRGGADELTAHLEDDLNKLGVKLRHRNSTAVATELHPKDLAEFFVAGLNSQLHVNRDAEGAIQLKTLDELDVKGIDPVAVEAQREELMLHLSEFVIVGGTFLRKALEPVYAVTAGFPSDGANRGSAPEIRVVDQSRTAALHRMKEHSQVVAFFAGDRREEAVEYAREMKLAQCGEAFEPEVKPRRIQVHDASSLKFDDERASLVIMAEKMAASFLRETIGFRAEVRSDAVRTGLENASTDSIIAWKALTAAMEAADHEALPTAMRTCLDVDAGEGKSLFTGYGTPPAVFEVALRKWDNREVMVDFSASSLPFSKP